MSAALRLTIALLALAYPLLTTAQDAALRREVRTAEELQKAVKEGAYHIIVKDHLDTRGLVADSSTFVMLLKNTTGIIEGDCEKPFTEDVLLTATTFDVPILENRPPGQCVIVTQRLLFEFQKLDPHGRVWIDNLYIRMQRRAGGASGSVVRTLAFNRVSAWMTNVTVQGDGGESHALFPFKNARVHLEDCTIADFKGMAGVIAALKSNSSIVFKNCDLLRNAVTDPRPSGYGDIPGGAGRVFAERADTGSALCGAVLEGGTLDNNPHPLFLRFSAETGGFYSDSPQKVFEYRTGTVVDALPLDAQSGFQGPGFLRAEDKPSVDNYEVEPPSQGAATTQDRSLGSDAEEDSGDSPERTASSSPGGGGKRQQFGFGIAAGVGIAVCLLVAAVAFFLLRKRRQKKAREGDFQTFSAGLTGYSSAPLRRGANGAVQMHHRDDVSERSTAMSVAHSQQPVMHNGAVMSHTSPMVPYSAGVTGGGTYGYGARTPVYTPPSAASQPVSATPAVTSQTMPLTAAQAVEHAAAMPASASQANMAADQTVSVSEAGSGVRIF